MNKITIALLMTLVSLSQPGCMWYRATIHQEFGDLFQATNYKVAFNIVEHVPGSASETHLDMLDEFKITRTPYKAFVEPGAGLANDIEWPNTGEPIEFFFVSETGNNITVRYLCNDNVLIHGSRHVIKIFPQRGNNAEIGVKVTYDDYQDVGSRCDTDYQHNGVAHAWL